MQFNFQPLEIPEVILIQVEKRGDSRGFIRETFKYSEFAAHGIAENFVQDNHSRSARGVLRGLHYQNPPQAQGKLVSVFSGEVFDVAVDIRQGSPTFGKWVGQKLSVENCCLLYVPPGFAHGFCVLSESADFVYKVTAEYAPELERGILWNDPDIGVQWNIKEPILSARDVKLPRLRDADIGFTYEK